MPHTVCTCWYQKPLVLETSSNEMNLIPFVLLSSSRNRQYSDLLTISGKHHNFLPLSDVNVVTDWRWKGSIKTLREANSMACLSKAGIPSRRAVNISWSWMWEYGPNEILWSPSRLAILGSIRSGKSMVFAIPVAHTRIYSLAPTYIDCIFAWIAA